MKYNKTRKAFFLDRDGVIIKDVGYLTKIKQLSFLKDTLKTLKLINKKNYLIIIITNQSVVGRKLISNKKLHEIHSYLKTFLKKRDIIISDIYYCPHHPVHAKGKFKIKCLCRKPGNQMIEKAIKKWKINRKESFMIGDRLIDLKAAKKSKIKFFYRSKNDFFKQVKGKIF